MKLNIEEILSFIDNALYNGEDWLDFKQIQRCIHDFIYNTLNTCQLGYGGDVYTFNENGTFNHNMNYYDKLVENIVSFNEDNCFITFNYDTFLDNALIINNRNITANYNMEFFEDETSSRINNKSKQNVDLLKLHGSLNWAYCEQCNEYFLKKTDAYMKIISETCTICNNKYSPILIPPTFKKVIPKNLERIWHKAEEYLASADTITIVGYSFPDADLEAKWLFKKALCKNSKKPILTLIDPSNFNEEGKLKYKIGSDRISELLGNFFSEIKYYKTFEEYCDILISKDYNK